KAFEEIGIPYVISCINKLDELLPTLKNPFCMIFAADYASMKPQVLKIVKKYPKLVWVYPWFRKSDDFFRENQMDARIWTLPKAVTKKILDSNPNFVFTATGASGLQFFGEWEKHGQRLISLPLACDTTLYNISAPYRKEFDGIQLAFVGGYWKSKGKQIDKYLRPLEDKLIIYGYNKWPYCGYRGHLPRAAEPSLYRQARICPTINEPTVKLLNGQINERVFKVFGSGGMTVVDAIPAYRDLFNKEELSIPGDENEFYEIVVELLKNDKLRSKYQKEGYEAVLKRHTYVHRAKKVMRILEVEK
ncbi:MAG: glycosyltransferase, partial [Candidatus Hodarchaeota archaeon]